MLSHGLAYPGLVAVEGWKDRSNHETNRLIPVSALIMDSGSKERSREPIIVRATFLPEGVSLAVAFFLLYRMHLAGEGVLFLVLMGLAMLVGVVLWVYIIRVNAVELSEEAIVLHKIGRGTVIRKGDVHKVIKCVIRDEFYVWFVNGTRERIIPKGLFRRGDVRLIGTYLELMIPERNEKPAAANQ